jgi:multidrug efflux pump subunit AcrA (membrane-fusion protein)
VNVSNVVTFEVKVEVTSPEKSLLRPEMTANVEVLVAERADVLLAPADAIVRKGGQTTVTVQRGDGATESREVRTGVSDGKRTEILSGLTADETVVVTNDGGSKWQGQSQTRRSGPPLLH